MSRPTPTTRPRKKQRLNPPVSTPSGRKAHTAPRPKRSRSDTLRLNRPTVQKRRPIHPPSTPPDSKRRRIIENPDVDMLDPSATCNNSARNVRPPTRLHDVLRKERSSSAMFREIHVQHSEALRQQTATSMPVSEVVEGSCSASVMSESAAARLSPEEMVEEIDASENTDIPRECEPGVQAMMLEDGRCAVCIVRQNGTRQTVIIDPPEVEQMYRPW